MLYVFEEFDGPSMNRIAQKKRREYRRGQADMPDISVPTRNAPRTSGDDLEMEIRDSRTSRFTVSVGGRRHSSITEVDGRDLGTQRTSGKWFEDADADDEKEMDVESIIDVRRPNASEMQGSIVTPSTHAWTMRMHG